MQWHNDTICSRHSSWCQCSSRLTQTSIFSSLDQKYWSPDYSRLLWLNINKRTRRSLLSGCFTLKVPKPHIWADVEHESERVGSLRWQRLTCDRLGTTRRRQAAPPWLRSAGWPSSPNVPACFSCPWSWAGLAHIQADKRQNKAISTHLHIREPSSRVGAPESARLFPREETELRFMNLCIVMMCGEKDLHVYQ